VIPMIASHGRGLNELKHTLVQMLNHQVRYEPKTPSILPAHKAILDELLKIIDPYIPEGYPHDWVALKLLEGDEELTAIMKKAMPGDNWELVHDILYQHEDAILDIAGARYEWVARINRAAVVQPKVSRSDLTSRLDKILTHPWWDIDTRFNARDCISIDIPNWRSDSNLVERTDIKLGRRITEYLDRRSEMAGRIFCGRCPRRFRHGADILTHPARFLHLSGVDGRHWLHGARSLSFRPMDAHDRAAWQEFYAHPARFWVQRAGSHGHAHH